MLLAYGDLAQLFPKVTGIQDHKLCFHTVATISDVPQFRGTFIPLEQNTGELKNAIENGAVAALWKKEKEIPRYTHNYSKIFFTNDLLKGLKDMMELIIGKLNQKQKAEIKVTNFLFSDEILLKEKESTYDIAVMSEKIMEKSSQLQDGREGAK